MAKEHMKILVTGSEGSIGQFIVEQLYRDFDEVEVIRVGRHPHQNLDGRSHYYWGELSNQAFCEQIFSEHCISYVIACAARWNGLNSDPLILSNNLSTITGILSALSDDVKKVVFISSSAVYQGETPLESAILSASQTSSYGASKLLSEQLVEYYARFKSFDYTIYRPFHVVSPAEKFEWGRSHVCTDMCYRIIEKDEQIDLKSLGNVNGTGFMWVGDFAWIVSKNIENLETKNQVINIGVNEEHSVRELANEVLKQARAANLIVREPELVESEVIVKSTDGRYLRMHRICEIPLFTGFSECVNQFIQHKYL